MLEVTPPGEQAKIISPTDNSAESPKPEAIAKATIGKTII